MGRFEDEKAAANAGLLEYLKENSFRRGNFLMASGRTSQYMIDLSMSLRSRLGIYYLQKALRWNRKFLEFSSGRKMPDYSGHPYETVWGGPMSGSDLVCMAGVVEGLCHNFFGVRKEEKGRGLETGRITGPLKKGDKVLMVEDVCTTGRTLSDAINQVIAFGAIPYKAFAVVDRGGMQYIEKRFGIPTLSLFTLQDFLNEDTKETKILVE